MASQQIDRPTCIGIRNRHITAIREAGKADRRALTDAIQAFAEYVDPNGEMSSRPDLAYSNMTRSIYAPFHMNVKARDAKELALDARATFDETELSFLQVAERTAAEIIWSGIAAKWNRADIKSKVRDTAGVFGKHLEDLRQMRGGAR